MTIPNDRLRELRTIIDCMPMSRDEADEFRALIDSALNPPGEIGEIVDGLRASLQVARRNGRGDEVKCYERAIAYLSYPGEQQQLLRESDREHGIEALTALIRDPDDKGTRRLEWLVPIRNWLIASRSAHKATKAEPLEVTEDGSIFRSTRSLLFAPLGLNQHPTPVSQVPPELREAAKAADDKKLTAAIILNVCELPDYTSPDDQPDLLQCTVTELEKSREILGGCP
jgi:hypothetical protein